MQEIIKLIFKGNSVILELDSGEKLNVSYDVYSMYKISSGQILDQQCYMELRDESEKFHCMSKGLSYLAVRNRSVEEMRTYLKKKNFSDKHVKDVIDFMKQKSYLNDYDFSLSFVKGKMKNGKSGKDLIMRDLYRKGVNRKTIDKVIKESGADITDEDALYELALKKYMSVKDKDSSLMKVSIFLRSRGFDYETISKVLRKIKSDINE